MPQRSDAAKSQPNVVHDNSVTQAGFTMIPNAVMLRKDLSMQAKLLYGYLSHIAWRSGEATTTPTHETICADMGISEPSVRKYLRELCNAPRRAGNPDSGTLLTSRRRGQGLPNMYVVYDAILSDEVEESSVQESTDVSVLLCNQEISKTKDPPTPQGDFSKPPSAVKVEGRFPSFDALCEVTGVTEGSPRVTQVAKALNGPSGIRALYWIEVGKWIEGHGSPQIKQEMHEQPERFEQALAQRIRVKAQRILARDPWRDHLTPSLVKSMWLDVEVTPEGGKLTASDVMNLNL